MKRFSLTLFVVFLLFPFLSYADTYEERASQHFLGKWKGKFWHIFLPEQIDVTVDIDHLVLGGEWTYLVPKEVAGRVTIGSEHLGLERHFPLHYFFLTDAFDSDGVETPEKAWFRLSFASDEIPDFVVSLSASASPGLFKTSFERVMLTTKSSGDYIGTLKKL